MWWFVVPLARHLRRIPSLKYKDKKWYTAGGASGARAPDYPQPEPISKILNEVGVRLQGSGCRV